MYLIDVLFPLLLISGSFGYDKRISRFELKWCGVNLNAASFDDLGVYPDVDVCCRAHYYCTNFIEGRTTSQNLYNPYHTRRYSCKCEAHFMQCLKKVNTDISTLVGNAYFNNNPTKCFMPQHPIKGCVKYRFHPLTKCLQYEVDITKPMRLQWMDVPEY